MDTVTRADDVDVFLLIHEYYPDLYDKWLSSITAPFFPKIWNQEQEKKDFLNDRGAITSESVASSLMSTWSDGPAVSLHGSLRVSPMTAALWASLALPLWVPDSMYFLGLSHAPMFIINQVPLF
jgi:hypothetical protein